MQSLGLNVLGLPAHAPVGLPVEKQMNVLHNMLSKVQQKDEDVHAWRAHMMRILAEGGLSQDVRHPSVLGVEERRVLAEARREFARKLSDKFLGSAARFLLEDQNSEGIAKLEERLVHELDLALRFSCVVWSRQEPLSFLDLQELSTTECMSSDDLMTVHSTQAPVRSLRCEDDDDGAMTPPGYHEGYSVVAVLQPAVETITTSTEGSQGRTKVARICSKARILVAAPISTSPPLTPIEVDVAPPELLALASVPSPAPSKSLPEIPATHSHSNSELEMLLPSRSFRPIVRPSSPKTLARVSPKPLLLESTRLNAGTPIIQAQ